MKKLSALCAILLIAVIASAPATPAASASDGAADTIYVNGKILTVDADFSIAEAVAVKGGRIVETGANDAVKKLAGSGTKTVDLGGKTVMPGMMDTHLHFMRYGLTTLQINCMDASKEYILGEIKSKAGNLGDKNLWIRGRGWNQELWADPVFPSKEDIDKVVAENPVALVRSDNHALWANSRALLLAGITKETKDPEGGVIHRGPDGEPTGILVDSAMDLINQKIPDWAESEQEMAYLWADKVYSSVGLTTVADAGDDANIPLIKKLIQDNKINTRIYAVLDKKTADKWFEEGKKPEIGLFDERMTIRAIKLKADGALGSRGAKLMADYSDKEGVTGNTLITAKDLLRYSKKCDELGFQLNIHAIGDKTGRDAVDVIEASVKSGRNDGNERRHGIVHAQVVSMSDLPRFGKLNILALMQPVHATGDMQMAETRLGPWRILGAYAWQTLINQRALVAGGSDSPNDYIEPLYGIHALVTRQNKDNLPTGGWYPQERISLEDAIRAYTINAAYAFFAEGEKGSIEKGKLADFVVLTQDIMTVPNEDIHKIEVEKTIIGDKVVFERGA
ncbi:MAG: amidohydrolase [Synergistaceae bacterium]|nr:amidohydrolase [Synergistaceae bacterium]